MDGEVEVHLQVPLSKLVISSRLWTPDLNPLGGYLALDDEKERYLFRIRWDLEKLPGHWEHTCPHAMAQGHQRAHDGLLRGWSYPQDLPVPLPQSRAGSSSQGLSPAAHQAATKGVCLPARLEETKHQSALEITQLKAERAVCQVRLQKCQQNVSPESLQRTTFYGAVVQGWESRGAKRQQ